MHCKNPHRVVAEMLRVTKPGGHILVVEPTNILNRMQFFDAVTYLSAKDQAKLYHIWACYHAGQKILTGAQHDIAPIIPDIFKKVGFVDIQAYQNDKVLVSANAAENFISMEK
jgi:ubiquinone/menaquinone biosynthesis C-methylase UbiE